jgi:hypothetical protein
MRWLLSECGSRGHVKPMVFAALLAGVSLTLDKIGAWR